MEMALRVLRRRSRAKLTHFLSDSFNVCLCRCIIQELLAGSALAGIPGIKLLGITAWECPNYECFVLCLILPLPYSPCSAADSALALFTLYQGVICGKDAMGPANSSRYVPRGDLKEPMRVLCAVQHMYGFRPV